jgi:phosphoadenosine phosphosulfate reductase
MWEQLLDTLKSAVQRYPDVVLASSLAAEDMVLTHAIAQAGLPIRIFTLDTGRLHDETLALVPRIRQRYGLDVELVRPDAAAVRQHVDEHGAFAFYEGIELRKACCGIRKVEPLRRALSGKSAWITGQRREQAVSREELAAEEQDAVFGLVKFNPLVAWSLHDVWQAIRQLDIPYNPLHDKGYPSIGCEPCTRAVREGEDPRAGRWWWENADSKECGLHAGNLASAPLRFVPPAAHG